MEKERIALLAQLLTGMKEAVSKMEAALKSEDMEQLSLAKKQIVELQAQINSNL